MAAVVSSEALISMQCLEVERQEENMMMGKIRNTLLGNVIGLLICVSQMAYAENVTGLESDPFQQIEQVTGELLTVIAGHAEAYPANEQVYFAALNNLSAASFVAPYKFIGFAALSVDKLITLSTLLFILAKIIFSAPIIFVFTNSIGLYSAAGTCFSAAA